MKRWTCFLLVALSISLAAGEVYAFGELPDGDFPISPCNMDAYVASGPIPSVGEYLQIFSFTYASTDGCADSFTIVYTTRLSGSCGPSWASGPNIATYAVATGGIYEVTQVNGSCLELCKCN